MNFDVIIVGAGLSGSYLARKVKELGLNTLIIEKSKGIGGRFSTKQYNILFPIVSRFQRLGMEYEQYGMNNEPPNAFNRHLISRKKFLEGKMNEKEWKRKLFLNEKVLSKEEEDFCEGLFGEHFDKREGDCVYIML